MLQESHIAAILVVKLLKEKNHCHLDPLVLSIWWNSNPPFSPRFNRQFNFYLLAWHQVLLPSLFTWHPKNFKKISIIETAPVVIFLQQQVLFAQLSLSQLMLILKKLVKYSSKERADSLWCLFLFNINFIYTGAVHSARQSNEDEIKRLKVIWNNSIFAKLHVLQTCCPLKFLYGHKPSPVLESNCHIHEPKIWLVTSLILLLIHWLKQIFH